jgi:hypothetical protein
MGFPVNMQHVVFAEEFGSEEILRRQQRAKESRNYSC